MLRVFNLGTFHSLGALNPRQVPPMCQAQARRTREKLFIDPAMWSSRFPRRSVEAGKPGTERPLFLLENEA